MLSASISSGDRGSGIFAIHSKSGSIVKNSCITNPCRIRWVMPFGFVQIFFSRELRCSPTPKVSMHVMSGGVASISYHDTGLGLSGSEIRNHRWSKFNIRTQLAPSQVSQEPGEYRDTASKYSFSAWQFPSAHTIILIGRAATWLSLLVFSCFILPRNGTLVVS